MGNRVTNSLFTRLRAQLLRLLVGLTSHMVRVPRKRLWRLTRLRSYHLNRPSLSIIST